MAYKIVETKSPKVPGANWTHVLTDKSNKIYDKKVKPAATVSKVGGYNDSGVSKKDYGI